MDFIDFDKLDEKVQRDFKKLLENYYSGMIHDDESLQKYVENLKNEELNVSKTLKLREDMNNVSL